MVIRASILGRPTPIYVDDFLPFRGATSTSLSFAGRSDDNSLWMAFMEKVWAKANGNY
jgi:Calpain family cysteine protease